MIVAGTKLIMNHSRQTARRQQEELRIRYKAMKEIESIIYSKRSVLFLVSLFKCEVHIIDE